MKTKTILSNYGDVLKPEEVQEILHTGRNSVYALLKNGEIKSLMVGGKYRIPKLYLLEYIYPNKDFTEEKV